MLQVAGGSIRGQFPTENLASALGIQAMFVAEIVGEPGHRHYPAVSMAALVRGSIRHATWINPRPTPSATQTRPSYTRTLEFPKTAKKIQYAIKVAFEGDLHALLMAIFKDLEYQIEVRIDYAKATPELTCKSRNKLSAELTANRFIIF